MKIYVINVPVATERRAMQEAQAKRFGLDMHFVNAIDAAGLDDEFCQRAANNWTRSISKKDIACFMSHRHVWALAVKETSPVMIIEDDVVFSPTIKDVLAVLAARSDPWNVIYDLEFAPGRHGISRTEYWHTKNPEISARYIYKNKIGLGAYVLSPQAAKRLHDAQDIYAMADAYVWTRPWLAPYQIEPAPAVQMIYLENVTNLESSAAHNREIRFENQSYLKRKLIRLGITLDEARRFIEGLRDIDKRPLKFDRDAFRRNQETSES